MSNDELRRLATDALTGAPVPPHLGFSSWESREGVEWLAEQLEAMAQASERADELDGQVADLQTENENLTTAVTDLEARISKAQGALS